MDSSIFKNWFKTKFVAQVKHYLNIKSLSTKLLLPMDNAPSHPSTEESCSQDELIRTKSLPANATSMIQSMDQGVLYYLQQGIKEICLKRQFLMKSLMDCTVCKKSQHQRLYFLLSMLGSKSRVAHYKRHGISY